MGYLKEPPSTEAEICRCGECARIIADNEDSYECRTHRILCKECLLMLHKRYVGVSNW